MCSRHLWLNLLLLSLYVVVIVVGFAVVAMILLYFFFLLASWTRRPCGKISSKQQVASGDPHATTHSRKIQLPPGLTYFGCHESESESKSKSKSELDSESKSTSELSTLSTKRGQVFRPYSMYLWTVSWPLTALIAQTCSWLHFAWTNFLCVCWQLLFSFFRLIFVLLAKSCNFN